VALWNTNFVVETTSNAFVVMDPSLAAHPTIAHKIGPVTQRALLKTINRALFQHVHIDSVKAMTEI